MRSIPSNNSDKIEVRAAISRREKRLFITLPWRLYNDDNHWRAPLRIERSMHLSPKQNPAFEHLECQMWLAWRNGKPVGRISAQIDQLRKHHHDDLAGYFGMLEAEDNAAVFQALTETAQDWLRERGMQHIHGPFNLTINEECGLLVEGFDTPPAVMMGHAKPYYAEQIEALGFNKAVDTLAYWVDLKFAHPRAMQRLLARYEGRIHVRAIDGKNFTRELDLIRDIFNDAWAHNWGFVPFTVNEFREVGKGLKLLLTDDLVQIAEVDGEPAAFIVGLPNLNEAIRDLNGKLLPFGLLKLLWRLKVKFPKTSRVPLMGVRQQYQQGPLGAALAYGVIGAMQKQLLAHGARGCELSWILEDNAGMRNIIESLGGHVYKTYRIYQKTL